MNPIVKIWTEMAYITNHDDTIWMQGSFELVSFTTQKCTNGKIFRSKCRV